jgi:hypothetical protein
MVLGGLGAAAVVVTSAVALAAQPTDLSFQIDTSGSFIKIGSRTFPVGDGTLVGTLRAEGEGASDAGDAGSSGGANACAAAISADKSNPTFQKVRVITFPAVDAQLELCGDALGQVQDTTSGSAPFSVKQVGIKVKLSGAFNCEIPCVYVDLTSNGGSDGQDYQPGDGTVKLVGDQFTVAKSTCGAVVDGLLGLPSPVGKNSAVLSLQSAQPFPTCQR